MLVEPCGDGEREKERLSDFRQFIVYLMAIGLCTSQRGEWWVGGWGKHEFNKQNQNRIFLQRSQEEEEEEVERSSWASRAHRIDTILN